MKIWLDDIRPAPEGYVGCKSVNIAKRTIESAEEPIVLIDCDHDLVLSGKLNDAPFGRLFRADLESRGCGHFLGLSK